MPTFPRTARLLRPGEFRNVFAQPIRLGDRFLTVLVRSNGSDQARLGMAVARRRIPGAVQRNLFKRIVRERFRLHRRQLGGHDIVVMPKSAAAGATREDLRASIDRQWAHLAGRGGNGRTAASGSGVTGNDG